MRSCSAAVGINAGEDAMKNRHSVAFWPVAFAVTIVIASAALAENPRAVSNSTDSPAPFPLSESTAQFRSSVGIASSLGAGSLFAAYAPDRSGYRSRLCNGIDPSWFIRVFHSRNVDLPPRGYDWLREEHWALAEALYRSALENPDRQGRVTLLDPRPRNGWR